MCKLVVEGIIFKDTSAKLVQRVLDGAEYVVLKFCSEKGCSKCVKFANSEI